MGENPSNTTTPGRQAIAVMQDFNKDIIFKIPTTIMPKRKRNKQETILDEDTYVEKIGEIIQRDFFPDLDKLKAQNEYLDALEKNDLTKIRELYRKYNDSNQPSTRQRLPSPATFETPANIHNSQNNVDEETTITTTTTPPTTTKTATTNITKIDDVLKEKRLSLDQFLNSHTSQDNDSFNEMLIESEKKHREKYSYLYQEEDKSELERLKQLQLPSIEQQAALLPTENKQLNLNIWNYKNKNSIMYIPDGCELTDQQRIELMKQRQEICHSNTRLIQNPFNDNQSKETIDELAKTHSQVLDGKIGIDGKELLKQQTPQIGGYSFVQTPSPNPNNFNDTPLMTWGEIEGTPFRLDNNNGGGGNNTPRYYGNGGGGAAFKMSAPGRREQLAIELAEKVGEKNRKIINKQKAIDQAKRNLINTPSPRRTTSFTANERLAVMSPAARRLATNQLKLGLNHDFNTTTTNGNNHHYGQLTPKQHTPVTTPKRVVLTPKLNLGIKRAGGDDNNLTDDLLKIDLPKRQKAADFF